jgi:hypothetical protein
VRERLEDSLAVLAEVRERGFPVGFESEEEFLTFIAKAEGELAAKGVKGAGVVVHGSSMHTRAPNDIDVAAVVDDQEFQSLADGIRRSLQSKGLTKKLADFEKEVLKGKIPGYRLADREAGLPVGQVLGTLASRKVQVSVIRRGSEFDLGPMMGAH